MSARSLDAVARYYEALAILGSAGLCRRRLVQGLRRPLPVYCDWDLQEYVYGDGTDPLPASVRTLLEALLEARPHQLVAGGVRWERVRGAQWAAAIVLHDGDLAEPAALAVA